MTDLTSSSSDTVRRHGRWTPYALASPATVVLFLIFVTAMVTLFAYSLRSVAGGTLQPGYNAGGWIDFTTHLYYWQVTLTTIKLGLLVTGICAVLGYPVAYALHITRRVGIKITVYVCLFAPLLTSVIVRTYGWELILGDHGLINDVLLRLHFIDQPIRLLYAFPGVVISMIHILLPFMVFPIVSVLGQVDPSLGDAASDLGAGPVRRFWRIILPLTWQGVLAGGQIVFALTVSSFATPSLLGGGRVTVLATQVYDNVTNLNWPLGSAAAYVLLASSLIALAAFNLATRATHGHKVRGAA